LIDGQGNFGSRDGDGAAAMRYTEARLTKIAGLLLSEIDEGTVDFAPNYDGSFQEPKLLPARLPFVLLNGASGIAVGMATEIPSHNLREVASAAIALMNIMMVSVSERTREIGIRKSLGATPGRILQQFLIEAIVICLLGGIGGIMLAIPIGNLIAQGISSGAASFIIPWLWMMTGIIICILVGLFSGIYPAFKASQMDPVDALRYE
jgi:hypothetical protein